MSAFQRFGNAEGDGEHDKSYHVIQCHDREQDAGDGTLRFVLLDNHQRGGGGGGCCDRTQRDGGCQRQLLRNDKMQSDQRDIYEQSRRDGLKYRDDGCLLAGLFRLDRRNSLPMVKAMKPSATSEMIS